MKIRIIVFVATIVFVLSGCSVYSKSSVVGKGIEQKATDVFFTNVSSGQNVIPDIIKDDYDYLLIFVYGQSYTVAKDGGYRVTEELDDNLYALGSISSTKGRNLVRVKDTEIALDENIANTAVDIIAKLCKKINKPVRFIIGNEGRGSRTILELMKESSIKSFLSSEEWEEFKKLDTYENRYSRVTDYLSNLKQWAEKNNKKILCPFFIYLQGESDIHTGVKKHGANSSAGGEYSTYKERLSVMLSDLKNDILEATGQRIAPAAFIDNVGNEQFHDKLNAISQAQTDVANENDGVYSCGPYYAYPSYGAHPTPDGRRWIGEAIAKLFYSTFLDGKIRSMIVNGYSIRGNKVFLNVKTQNPPIVLDNYASKQQTNSGFKAFDSKMNEIKINSVAVKDTKIVLSFDSLPKEDFYISYGSNGYGNVRDSDDWESTYRYSSNEIGNMSSLAHYPVNQSGNPIIGRHYPMWNWLPFGFVRIRL